MRRLLPLLVLFLLVAPARAAFPGANGRLVVQRFDKGLPAGPVPTPTQVPQSGLYVMQPDGSAATRVTDNGLETAPAVGPDGRTVTYGLSDIGGGFCFVVLDLGSHGCVRPSGTPPIRNPSLSPDAARIAFDTDSGLFTAKPDETDLQALAPGYAGVQPSWSPDGSLIAFTGHPSGTGDGQSDLYVIKPDGTGLTPVMSTPAASEHDADWSPDGARLVYVAGLDVVRSVALDGTGDRLVGTGTFPAASPDGTRVAAIADGHVYTYPAAGGAPTKITSSSRFVDTSVAWGRAVAPLPTPTASPTPVGSTTHHVQLRVRWTRPRGAKVTRRTRKVRVSSTPPQSCAYYQRAVVRRTAHAIIITVFYDGLVSDYGAIPCPYVGATTHTVALGARLGRRAIKDGSTKPPRTRYRAP